MQTQSVLSGGAPPLIGVLTLPMNDYRKSVKHPEFNEYILGVNNTFLEMGGCKVVMIGYKSDKLEENEELYQILE